MTRDMIRFGKALLGLVVWLSCASTTRGFSLLGPNPQWQLDAYDGLNLDYNFNGDIGGPMRVNEGYRWNIPTITYAFDQSFVNYFGFEGISAVQQAIQVFNSLGPINQITSDGFSFFVNGQAVPSNSTFQNTEARTLGLLDVKSTAMRLLIEELGLAEPERYAWALLSRQVVNRTPDPDETNYFVANLNFDPITLRPTNAVNGILYGYQIFEFDAVVIPDFAEALETLSDPLATFPFTSVAGGRSVLTAFASFTIGQNTFFSNAGRVYTGLTHDDVGGLRWLYHPRNFAVENLETNVVFGTPVLGQGRSPWQPFFTFTNVTGGGTNLLNTNLLVSEALRGGINRIRFQRVNFDSLLGRTLVPITNRYMDRFITNGQTTLQPVQRVINFPDIVFTAERLGLQNGFFPALTARTGTGNWQNNDAINGIDSEVDGGPGVIQGPVTISFTDQLPFFFNSTFSLLTGFPGTAPPSETNHVQTVIWGTFDETSTPPIIYPQYGDVTLQNLRRFAVGGGN